MANWTKDQLIFITTAYFSQGKSITRAQRTFQKEYKVKTSPSKKIVLRCLKNFSSSGNLDKKKSKGRSVSVTTASNLEKAKQIIEEKRNVSLRHLSQQLGTSYGSAHTIVKKKLFLHPYKIQICQKLQPGDFDRRVQFCEWLLQKLEDPDFLGGLIMSDEAHFSLSGYVNKQNMRFWAKENPMEIKDVPLHSERVTVWCGFMEGCIIGPYFFENDIEQAVTVNGQRYYEMLDNFFIPQVEAMDVADIHFQQDGATCHTTRENMTLLRGQFPGKVISRFGDVEWPARSPDLSPLDFFLWGYLKDKVYRDNPKTVTELKEAIATEIRAIGPGVTSAVMNSMKKRAEICIQSGGRHMKNIIFHK